MAIGNGDAASRDGSALTAYEWLRLFSSTSEVDTQTDILRHLEAADVPESQRASVHELHRVHFAQLLRARRDRRRDDVERISERRSLIRARGREKWRTALPGDGMKVEQVQEQFPALYQSQAGFQPTQGPRSGVTQTLGGRSQQPVSRAPAANSAPIGHPPAHQNTRNGLPAPSSTDRVVPPVSHHQIPPPTPPPAPSLSGPQRTLSELLRKKSSGEMERDGDDVMAHNPYRPQQRDSRTVSRGRNPFQTAGDRLQKDRASGKSHMDDYDDDGMDRGRRNGRGQARQGPRSGSYHPVNPHLLFGGGGGDLDDGGSDDLDASGAIRKKFVSPIVRQGEDRHTTKPSAQQVKPTSEDDEDIDPRLKSCDPELIAKIEMEIVDNGDPITFDDIAGLQFAKKCVNELVIWPMARPDIFTGLRALPKGLLLFGPPGTGKTLIGKAIASQSGATFFSISASSLTSKWIGEGEKLVRTLFAVAAVKQPSVIFIDEIDSLLTQRSSEENEASRRMKTEFLVQLDGAGTKAKDVILVVGATNRPQELDEAARRRFVKRLYIPLPSYEARMDLMNRLLKDNKHCLSGEDLKVVAEKTAGYSGADVRALCTEAAMGPIRSCTDIQTMDANSVRPITIDDFNEALRGVRSSVAAKDLDFYKAWNDEFGSFAFVGHEG